MLSNTDFRQRVLSRIRDHGASAEAAVATVVAELQDTFKASPQPFIQDKAADILDIGRRVIQCLANESDREAHSSQIVVAPSLMPSEFVRLAHQGTCEQSSRIGFDSVFADSINLAARVMPG